MRLLSRIFSRRRRYDDISVSIEEHIEERIDELMADGLSRVQAQQTARCEFGNVSLIAQRSRDVWQWPLLETLLADLKFPNGGCENLRDLPQPFFSRWPSALAPTPRSSAWSTVSF
jgi:hypothetical protein